MLTGQNGILTQAKNAKEKSIAGSQQEAIELAYTTAMMDKYTLGTSDLSEKIKSELASNGYSGSTVTNNSGEYTIELSDGSKYKIDVNGKVTKVEPIPTDKDEIKSVTGNEKGYVGYYADLNDDGKITLEDDGIIYADLAVGGSDQWYNSNGDYSIPQEENLNNLKQYYISDNTSTIDPLKTEKGIIRAVKETSGTDRFYVMALEDFSENTYYWYFNASGNMSDYSTYTSRDFGCGKENTRKMIARWNLGTGTGDIDGISYTGYGAQTTSGAFVDLWGVIQTKVQNGWFIPSRAEWSAFAANLNISKTSTESI